MWPMPLKSCKKLISCSGQNRTRSTAEGQTPGQKLQEQLWIGMDSVFKELIAPPAARTFSRLKGGKTGMNPQTLDNILAALREMITIELAVGHCYECCAGKWPDDTAFWMRIAGEEKQHARHVEKMIELVSSRPEEFAPDQSFAPEAIQSFRSHVQSREQQLLENTLPYRQMLALLLDIESSMIESRYFKIVKSRDSEYSYLLNILIEQSRMHQEKLQEKIAELSTS
jgi:rubrerythrin